MDSLSWLRDSHLVEPVRRLLRGDVVTVEDWSAEPLAGGVGKGLGVWRVTGKATVDNSPATFALILKGWGVAGDSGDSTAWDWPHREIRACGSGLLDELPGGICAPRCLGEAIGTDGSSWAWMTSMSAGAIAAWDRGHFGLVAQRLGQFNGAYLAGRPLPDADWLSRGCTRGWTDAAGEAIAQFDHFLEHPVVSRSFPPAERREIDRLFAERHRWFDALDTLPQTFCHLDAFPRNIFLRPGPDGELQPGLIDWSYSGIAAVGEEIAPLVSASAIFGHTPGISFAELDTLVFQGYLEGLRAAGWRGDERVARMGYAGSVVMRYVVGSLRQFLPALANDQVHPLIEQVFGVSIDGLTERMADHTAWAFTLAGEFRTCLAAMPPRLPDAA
jgi:hypothetical protein